MGNMHIVRLVLTAFAALNGMHAAQAVGAGAGAAAFNALPSTGLNETVIGVPAGPTRGDVLETTLYRPDGAGPFPLLVINHGKALGDPKEQERERFETLAAAFVRRGYAVMIPMRRGFAQSGGKYIEHGCNMAANGYTQAADVRDVVQFARSQPWIDGSHIVVAGQSYGGLATMALATQRLPGVRGVMNFAGGLRVTGHTCDWQGALVRAFGEFGQRSKVASLWMYGENDSYFPPALAQRMHHAYTAMGGEGELVVFGPFQRDAHTLLASSNGEAVWAAPVERFLARIGMPVAERFTVL